MSQSFIKAQAEVRLKAWEEAKALLDTAAAEKRDLSGEEQEKFDRINAELDERAAAIEAIRKVEEREAKAAAVSSNFAVSEVTKSDYDYVRALAKGEIRSHNFETRGTLTPSNASGVVPTSFVARVYDLAREVGPMLDPNVVEIFNTQSGEDLKLPVLTNYATAVLETAGASIDESEPTFSSITLQSFKYGMIVPVARELVEDSGVDIAEVLARAAGNSLGYAANTALTTGTGSSQPNGIITAAGTGVSGTIAGGLFVADDLISLIYSVDGAVRRLQGTGWMMAPTAIRNARKLKDNDGQYLFAPGLNGPTADTLLGYRVYENPTMAAVGSASASVGFGYLPSYKVRIAGGLRVDRSDDFKFGNDIITFRFLTRIDGDLSHQDHFKIFKGSAA
jgi:HK97 family phage major capsid protein